jgi:hypothetical protein
VGSQINGISSRKPKKNFAIFYHHLVLNSSNSFASAAIKKFSNLPVEALLFQELLPGQLVTTLYKASWYTAKERKAGWNT